MSIGFSNKRDGIKGSLRGQRAHYLEVREVIGRRVCDLRWSIEAQDFRVSVFVDNEVKIALIWEVNECWGETIDFINLI